MNILLTGASGFLGAILRQDFINQGHEVDGISRARHMEFSIDLSTDVPVLNKPYDLVVHAAGKAHLVPKTQEQAQEFMNVNVKGTLHLLKGLDKADTLPKQFVFISTVAVYGMEAGELITEDFPLKGNTPYAKSKIEAENLVQEWGKKHQVPVLIVRLPLIAGPNPPGNLGAMMRAISGGYYFRIGNAQNRKSIILATDISNTILTNTHKHGIFNLTDGYHPTLAEIEEIICRKLKKKLPRSIPLWALKLVASVGDLVSDKAPINSNKLNKLTSTLTFSSLKAEQELNFNPNAIIHSGF